LPCSAALDEEQLINQLILQLGSDNFRDREKAMESLRKIGRHALHALRRAKNSDDPEIRNRSIILIRQIDRSFQVLRTRGASVHLFSNKKPTESAVESVSMNGATFEDDDLINLRDCINLRWLDLSHARITNTGLAHIEHLSKLEGLSLYSTPLNDISTLAKVTKLECLCIGGSEITDKGLAPIKHLSKLWTLDLCFTNITDEGVAHLARLINLHRLILSKTKNTDKGLTHLRGLKELKNLRLDGTQITDAGLVHLKELKKLEDLYLQRTKVTVKGVEDLKKSLPAWNDNSYRCSLHDAKSRQRD
jgi:Leucine-rich repeat (LRR) protein